jgi:hypothetical protein
MSGLSAHDAVHGLARLITEPAHQQTLSFSTRPVSHISHLNEDALTMERFRYRESGYTVAPFINPDPIRAGIWRAI